MTLFLLLALAFLGWGLYGLRRGLTQRVAATPDMTMPTRAGDVHSRKVVVAAWTEEQMADRRLIAEARARNLFARGLVSAAADALIASQMSDGQPHVVEVGS